MVEQTIYVLVDYKLALKEYSIVGGQIPIPPRYAFGVFYSRYWAYNDIGEMVIFYFLQVYRLLSVIYFRMWCVVMNNATFHWMFW